MGTEMGKGRGRKGEGKRGGREGEGKRGDKIK